MPAVDQRASTSVLIVACRNPPCRKAGAVDDVHDQYGWREWTAAFASDGRGRHVPVFEDATRCPDCGEEGVVYAY